MLQTYIEVDFAKSQTVGLFVTLLSWVQRWLPIFTQMKITAEVLRSFDPEDQTLYL